MTVYIEHVLFLIDHPFVQMPRTYHDIFLLVVFDHYRVEDIVLQLIHETKF
jgi:hypothetical protein